MTPDSYQPVVQAWLIVRVIPRIAPGAYEQEVGFTTTRDGVEDFVLGRRE